MKRTLSLLVALLMALAMLPAALAETAQEPVTITMFYQSTRPMNEYTEMTRQYVRDTIGVDMELI